MKKLPNFGTKALHYSAKSSSIFVISFSEETKSRDTDSLFNHLRGPEGSKTHDNKHMVHHKENPIYTYNRQQFVYQIH